MLLIMNNMQRTSLLDLLQIWGWWKRFTSQVIAVKGSNAEIARLILPLQVSYNYHLLQAATSSKDAPAQTSLNGVTKSSIVSSANKGMKESQFFAVYIRHCWMFRKIASPNRVSMLTTDILEGRGKVRGRARGQVLRLERIR